MGTYGKGFLGDISSRLAKALGIDGLLPTSITGDALPVVLVADATLPGNNDRSGKRFAVRINCVGQTSAIRAIVGDRGVILEGIVLRNDATAVGSIDISLIGSDQVTGYAFGATGLVIDTPTLDRPPLELGAGAAFGARRVLALFDNVPISTALPLIPLSGYLAPGAAIAVTATAGITQGMLYGRIY